MKVAIFLKMLLNAIKRILGVAGFVLCCSISAHAGNSKAFDKPDPPSHLVLTLSDQWLAEEKVSQPINRNAATRNNETQTSALKRTHVNVDCDMDVIENTAADVPLSKQLFGQCDLHYHY
ncbi:MAG: hypothetical protein WC762_05315 [Methylobacter sp.]|jgi:hypothetical protein